MKPNSKLIAGKGSNGKTSFVAPPVSLCSGSCSRQIRQKLPFYAGCSTVAGLLTHRYTFPSPTEQNRLNVRTGKGEKGETFVSTALNVYQTSTSILMLHSVRGVR